MSQVRRRQVLLHTAAFLVAPFAHAQQSVTMRRIGVLLGWAENDSQARLSLAAFKEGLAPLGWVEGRNLRIDLRWSAADAGRASALANELVALKPDLIFCSTTPVTAALQQATRRIPIVFAVVNEPVGSGFVKTLARPGGNITGLTNLEPSLAEKWVQLLKEMAPRVARVGVMFNPDTVPFIENYLRRLQAAASRLHLKTFNAPVRNESDIEAQIAGLGSDPGGGLVTMADSFTIVHRKSIIDLAARHKVTAIYSTGAFCEDGGLISYGGDLVDLCRRAAPYVDRILRGEKPANLPVEQPTKFELVVNLKTAKTLGLTVPQSILLRADRLIE